MNEEKVQSPTVRGCHYLPATINKPRHQVNNPPPTYSKFTNTTSFLPTPTLPSPVLSLSLCRTIVGCSSIGDLGLLPVWFEHTRTIQLEISGLRMWRETRNATGSSSGDFFYRVKPECVNDVPKTSFKIKVEYTYLQYNFVFLIDRSIDCPKLKKKAFFSLFLLSIEVLCKLQLSGCRLEKLLVLENGSLRLLQKVIWI